MWGCAGREVRGGGGVGGLGQEAPMGCEAQAYTGSAMRIETKVLQVEPDFVREIARPNEVAPSAGKPVIR